MALLKKLDRFLDRKIGLDRIDPSILGLVRAQQLGSIINLTPAMMAGNVICATSLLYTFRQSAHIGYLLAWAGIVGIFAIVAMRAWFETRVKAPRRRASHRAVKKAFMNGASLGTLWGVLPLLTLDGGSNGIHMMVAAVMTGMICGSGFALAAMPQAVASFLTPLFAGSFASIFISGIWTNTVLAILLVTFAAIVITASLATAKTFAGRIVAQAESDERGQVIGMLLKNFEENASDWLWATDAQGRLVHVTARFANAAGTDEDVLRGQPFEAFLEEAAVETDAALNILSAISDQSAFRDKELVVEIQGTRRWWRMTGQPFSDETGQFTGYRGVCTDITSQKQAEERVSYLAHNDPLTGVANRSRFNEQLNQAVSRMSRYGVPFAVLYLDLDQFKPVNDTKGHDVGDRLLAEVAKRFSKELRDSDILARLGGDEFAIIMSNTSKHEDAFALAQRLIEAVSRTFVIGQDQLSIGASIGIAMAPEHAVDGEQILRCADLALYRAKQDGRRVCRFFEAEMDRHSQELRALEFDLGMAVMNAELELNYQPLMNAETGEPTGFEALIRWNHTKRGLVSPGLFIPIAERTGLIKSIGEWVLNEACRAAVLWPDHLTVAVNLSPRQFESDRIIEIVAEALKVSGLNSNRLEIEITESLLMDNSADVLKRLHALKDLGVSIALDDFGTGYSSLAYLWKFPFDKIKIDQSFVSAIEHDGAARDILRTIASLGETLHMRITAEGVETAEQAEFLQSIAHQLQGFHFARPIKERDLAAFLLTDFAKRVPEAVEIIPPVRKTRRTAS